MATKRKTRRRVGKAIRKYFDKLKGNPPRVKGHKVKGGRAVTLRNFTGTVVKKGSQVIIRGRGKRK